MKPEPCFVYVISAGESAVKIGMADNPKNRVAALQTGSFLPLQLRYVVVLPSREIARDIEQMFHETAAKTRILGEWFSLTPLQATGCLASLIVAVAKQCLDCTWPEATALAQQAIIKMSDAA